MNEPRRRQRANHRDAADDTHSGKSRGFVGPKCRMSDTGTVSQLVKIVIVRDESFLVEMLTRPPEDSMSLFTSARG